MGFGHLTHGCQMTDGGGRSDRNYSPLLAAARLRAPPQAPERGSASGLSRGPGPLVTRASPGVSRAGHVASPELEVTRDGAAAFLQQDFRGDSRSPSPRVRNKPPSLARAREGGFTDACAGGGRGPLGTCS